MQAHMQRAVAAAADASQKAPRSLLGCWCPAQGRATGPGGPAAGVRRGLRCDDAPTRDDAWSQKQLLVRSQATHSSNCIFLGRRGGGALGPCCRQARLGRQRRQQDPPPPHSVQPMRLQPAQKRGSSRFGRSSSEAPVVPVGQPMRFQASASSTPGSVPWEGRPHARASAMGRHVPFVSL